MQNTCWCCSLTKAQNLTFNFKITAVQGFTWVTTFYFQTMALCHRYRHFTSKRADRVYCFCLLWISQEIAYNESHHHIIQFVPHNIFTCKNWQLTIITLLWNCIHFTYPTNEQLWLVFAEATKTVTSTIIVVNSLSYSFNNWKGLLCMITWIYRPYLIRNLNYWRYLDQIWISMKIPDWGVVFPRKYQQKW